jgi:hypothetical protein
LEGKICKLSLDKENKFKEGSWKFTNEREVFCVLGKKKEENECVKKISSHVWKCVVHGKGVCKQEHERKLCVTNI